MASSPSEVNVELPYRPEELDRANRKLTRFRSCLTATENILLLVEPEIGTGNISDIAEIGRELDKMEFDFIKLKRLQLQRQHFEACLKAFSRCQPQVTTSLSCCLNGNSSI